MESFVGMTKIDVIVGTIAEVRVAVKGVAQGVMKSEAGAKSNNSLEFNLGAVVWAMTNYACQWMGGNTDIQYLLVPKW